KLIGEMASKPDGYEVAVEVLGMRIFAEREQRTTPDQELLRAGRELVRQMPFESTSLRDDYHIAEIVKFCFVGEEGKTTAHEISVRIRELLKKRSAFASVHDDLLHALLAMQPNATLDGFFGGASNDNDIVHLGFGFWHRTNPFDAVPENE